MAGAQTRRSSRISDRTASPTPSQAQADLAPKTDPTPAQKPTAPVPEFVPCTTGTLALAKHTLCLPTHSCLWTTPHKALTLHAQRAHWLQRKLPLEQTRGAKGRLPALVDRFGRAATRNVVVKPQDRGRDVDEVFEETVRERWDAVMLPGELGRVEGGEERRKQVEGLGRLLEMGEWE